MTRCKGCGLKIKKLRGRIKASTDDLEKHRLKARVDYMRGVEMAVVVSEENGEEEKFEKQNLNFRPHRKRMNELDENGHDLEYNLKDPKIRSSWCLFVRCG